MDMVNDLLKNVFHFYGLTKLSSLDISFLHNCMENISVLTKCNVLFNNEHLILNMIFLVD